MVLVYVATMNVTLLKKLCAVPSQTYHEDKMVRFLTDLVKRGGEARFGRCFTDRFKNVFVVKGHAEHYPCVAAHIDTVHPLRNVHVLEDGDVLRAEYRGKPAGFGADDKGGVYICLELLQRFDNIAVAFFAAEEHGCQGAKKADIAFFDRLGYMLEFDCPSRGLFSYTSCSERLFENQGEFIRRALPVLEKHGVTHWQNHPYTDVMKVRQRTTLSCMNLSCGYYNWHADNEYLRLSDTAASLEMATELLGVLNAHRYDFHRDRIDEAKPLIEIGKLHVEDKALAG